MCNLANTGICMLFFQLNWSESLMTRLITTDWQWTDQYICCHEDKPNFIFQQVFIWRHVLHIFWPCRYLHVYSLVWLIPPISEGTSVKSGTKSGVPQTLHSNRKLEKPMLVSCSLLIIPSAEPLNYAWLSSAWTLWAPNNRMSKTVIT